MGVTYKVVEGTLLTTSAATLYTAPSTVLVSIVRSIVITNNDATDRAPALWAFATAGSATPTTCVRSSSSNNVVSAGKTELWDTQIAIAASGIFQAACPAATGVVSVRLFIVEIT